MFSKVNTGQLTQTSWDHVIKCGPKSSQPVSQEHWIRRQINIAGAYHLVDSEQ